MKMLTMIKKILVSLYEVILLTSRLIIFFFKFS